MSQFVKIADIHSVEMYVNPAAVEAVLEDGNGTRVFTSGLGAFYVTDTAAATVAALDGPSRYVKVPDVTPASETYVNPATARICSQDAAQVAANQTRIYVSEVGNIMVTGSAAQTAELLDG